MCIRDRARNDGRGRVADGVGHKAGQNPTDHHESHAERDEHAALFGRHALGEHRGHHRDAGSHAEAGDQPEHCKEHDVVRERLRQREQAVEHDRDDERLFAAYPVGYDASHSAAKHHAEQTPRGERSHEGARIRVVGPERVRHEQIRRIDDHEVIAVEDHGERQQDENDPGMRAYTDGIDDFRYREFLLVHQFPFDSRPNRPFSTADRRRAGRSGSLRFPPLRSSKTKEAVPGELQHLRHQKAMPAVPGVHRRPARSA